MKKEFFTKTISIVIQMSLALIFLTFIIWLMFAIRSHQIKKLCSEIITDNQYDCVVRLDKTF